MLLFEMFTCLEIVEGWSCVDSSFAGREISANENVLELPREILLSFSQISII